MAETVRLYVDLEQDQADALKDRARTLGLSESELIRRCIDQAAPPQSEDDEAERQQAWERVKAFIDERTRRLPALNAARGWTREELYEERLRREPRRY